MLKPKTLKPGNRIALIAPSGWSEPDFLTQAVAAAKTDYGLDITIHPQCFLREGNSAGSTQDKIKAFHDVWCDPSVDAVFMARGGSRTIHMLDGLDWDRIAKHSKILIGFSDITVLLNTLYSKANVPSFHGMHVTPFHPEKSHEIIAPTLDLLSGHWQNPLFPVDANYNILQSGDVTAPLIGGNLCMTYTLMATGSYEPDWQGKILMLEDVEEDLRYLDRMLGAMRLRGVFKQVKGLVFGQVTGTTDTSTHPFGRTLEDMVREHVLPDIKGPVVMNAPFGHVPLNHAFPVGIPARLIAETGAVSLQLTESPFADA